jgi:hypothetical protein
MTDATRMGGVRPATHARLFVAKRREGRSRVSDDAVLYGRHCGRGSGGGHGCRKETPEPASRRWCNSRVARAAAFVGALVAVLILASPVYAAAPNYILVSGEGIRHPILLGDWNENLALLSALVNAPRARGRAVHGLLQRPRFDLAEFWAWGDRPPPTRPSQAHQHGSFYPAHGSKPPVIVLMVNGYKFSRLVPASVLNILARHHVPLRL